VRYILAMMILLITCVPCIAQKIPTVQEAIASKTDIWGDLAMKQPNGPSYQFF